MTRSMPQPISEVLLRSLAAVLVVGVIGNCGGDSPAAAPTNEDRLVGAWEMVGIEEEGIFRAIDEAGFVAVVFEEDGSGAFSGDEGEASLEDACGLEDSFTWELAEDDTSITVHFSEDNDIVWVIEDLDAAQFVFEEGTDLFHFARLGDC